MTFELEETPVGAGQRVNLPRPSADSFEIYPTNAVADQVIDISEVRQAERSVVASTHMRCVAV